MTAFKRWESLGYVVNHVARLFARSLDHRIRGSGASLGQFPVLLALWEQEGLTQAELSRRVRIEQPTMANTLSRMGRDGLIRRRDDPADRRRATIHLTPKGRRLEGPLTDKAREVNALAVRGLTVAERKTFNRLLKKILVNLEKDPAGERR